MTFNIDLGNILKVAGVAALGYLCYKGIVKENNRMKEFKEYKEDQLRDRDLDEDTRKASLNNPAFDPEERAFAFDILSIAKNSMKQALYKKTFDKSLNKFDEICSNFLNGDVETRKAYLLYLKNSVEREHREELARQEKHDRYMERQHDIDKLRTISDAVTNAAKAAASDVNVVVNNGGSANETK